MTVHNSPQNTALFFQNAAVEDVVGIEDVLGLGTPRTEQE